MDLDNMKNVWSEMSERIEKQNKITHEIVLKMAHRDSKNKLKKIFRFEVAGALWGLCCFGFLILNFDKLDTPAALLSGIISSLICGISLAMWFVFFRKANKVNILDNSYKQTLIDFNRCRKTYQLNKKLDYFLGLGLLIAISPLVFKLTRNSDIFSVPLPDLLLYVVGGSIAYSILIYVVLKYYDVQMREINKLLKELQSE